ncbi:NUDIX family hydrolase [Halalkaliarchaeum sp. AArc-CO]|uniref:NUDIX hydrolase n=1 Tax=unclassified Halalkaliarchaeum TaxID=2678344 RepID=UPI00217E9AB6|nr:MULTISPECIES: NUDIX hydrolase [unclassified Halalkaliarchaeum]MDR5671559.1 NUDIX hydrolase [Halalkaliarchaeum sp. AArc-GB]UWG51059.1 NUDIX family hydrolase [Halalkaliarchaeum sp. AArc-CO]
MTDGNDEPETLDRRRVELPGEPEWPVLESRIEYETDWFLGGYDLVEQPDGTRKRYYWAELPPAVVVVARAGDELLFVEQYRPTIRETQLELPAGIVEEGESFTGAAIRELEEETGFRPSSTAVLETVWCSTGLLRHRRAYVYADGLEPGDRELDSNEFLAPRALPIAEAVPRVREGSTNDATLEGLLLAEREGVLEI